MPPRDDLFVCPACAPPGGTHVSVDALRFLKAAGAIAPDRLETWRSNRARLASSKRCTGAC